MRAGSFREISKPRARANSHPDLQALLDSYDAAGPAQHTVMWTSEEDQEAPEDSEGFIRDESNSEKTRRLSSDDGMDLDTFDS